MKINGCGQAKILPPDARNLLLSQGFMCQRDRSLNELCYYLACRSAEARQLLISDVISLDGSVKEVIVIRKVITKGKQATRSIPTHSNLKESLEQYFRDSRELSQSLLELTDRSNYLLLVKPFDVTTFWKGFNKRWCFC